MTYAEPRKQPPVVNRSAPKATVVPILIYEDVAKGDFLAQWSVRVYRASASCATRWRSDARSALDR